MLISIIIKWWSNVKWWSKCLSVDAFYVNAITAAKTGFTGRSFVYMVAVYIPLLNLHFKIMLSLNFGSENHVFSSTLIPMMHLLSIHHGHGLVAVFAAAMCLKLLAVEQLNSLVVRRHLCCYDDRYPGTHCYNNRHPSNLLSYCVVHAVKDFCEARTLRSFWGTSVVEIVWRDSCHVLFCFSKRHIYYIYKFHLNTKNSHE